MVDVARLARVEADRRARTHGITRAQWVILDQVQQAPGLTQRELAEHLEVVPITVGRLVDRLEVKGVVERRPDPQDRRVWRLHLRPDAQHILDSLDIQQGEISTLLTDAVGAEPLAHVLVALRQMRQNLLELRNASPPPDPAGLP